MRGSTFQCPHFIRQTNAIVTIWGSASTFLLNDIHDIRGVPTERRKPVDEPNWVIVTIYRTVGTPSLCDLRLFDGLGFDYFFGGVSTKFKHV